MAGYSGTPLWKKLGLKPQFQVALINGPRDYERLLEPIPDGIKIGSRVTSKTDIIHVFSTEKLHLKRSLISCLKSMKSSAVIWASWPKRSSGLTSEITEDTVRAVALPLGLVDVKVCAIDETWSGLKLVVRRENREAG